jgi:hypothetical protein
MDKLADFTGYLSIALFLALGSRYVLKAYFKTQAKTLDPQSKKFQSLTKILALNKALHPYLGFLILILIALHAYLQTGFVLSFSNAQITGMVTFSLMAFNVISGIFGQYIFKKPRPKYWLSIHRGLSVLILIAILVHYFA